MTTSNTIYSFDLDLGQIYANYLYFGNTTIKKIIVSLLTGNGGFLPISMSDNDSDVGSALVALFGLGYGINKDVLFGSLAITNITRSSTAGISMYSIPPSRIAADPSQDAIALIYDSVGSVDSSGISIEMPKIVQMNRNSINGFYFNLTQDGGADLAAFIDSNW